MKGRERAKGGSGAPPLAYSASPSMDLLLHHHQRIKKQKEKGKEKEMTRRRRWGADPEEKHLDLLPALEETTLEAGAEARRRRQQAGGG